MPRMRRVCHAPCVRAWAWGLVELCTWEVDNSTRPSGGRPVAEEFTAGDGNRTAGHCKRTAGDRKRIAGDRKRTAGDRNGLPPSGGRPAGSGSASPRA